MPKPNPPLNALRRTVNRAIANGSPVFEEMPAPSRTQYIELRETIGADMAPRFYANGKRISREEFYSIKDRAARLECFHTKARQLPGGKFRRTNYTTAVLA